MSKIFKNKYNISFTKLFSFILLICLFTSTVIFAANKEYAISAINLIVSVPEELNVLTRNVSEGNAALEKLDASANEILTSYTNNNIYLNAFPDDLSYEIIITSTAINNSDAKSFKDIPEAELFEYIAKLIKSYNDAKESELLNDNYVYESDNAKYILTKLKTNTSTGDVYTVRYYTVTNGYNYYYTMQSNNEEILNNSEYYLSDIVDSANYTEVKSSLTESSLFMELFETFIGFGLTVLVLGLIIFALNKASKNKR